MTRRRFNELAIPPPQYFEIKKRLYIYIYIYTFKILNVVLNIYNFLNYFLFNELNIYLKRGVIFCLSAILALVCKKQKRKRKLKKSARKKGRARERESNYLLIRELSSMSATRFSTPLMVSRPSTFFQRLMVMAKWDLVLKLTLPPVPCQCAADSPRPFEPTHSSLLFLLSSS